MQVCKCIRFTSPAPRALPYVTLHHDTKSLNLSAPRVPLITPTSEMDGRARNPSESRPEPRTSTHERHLRRRVRASGEQILTPLDRQTPLFTTPPIDSDRPQRAKLHLVPSGGALPLVHGVKKTWFAFHRPSMAADATVRAPLRREKSSSARSFDADGLLDHDEDRGKSLSSAGRIRWLTLACSLTQVFAASSGAHGARRR